MAYDNFLMIILKFTKKQVFNLSLKNTFLEKPQEDWPSAFLWLMDFETWNAAFVLLLFSGPSIHRVPASIVKEIRKLSILLKNFIKTKYYQNELPDFSTFPSNKLLEKIFCQFFLFISFAYLLHYYIIPSGVFRTQSNSYDGAFLRK